MLVPSKYIKTQAERLNVLPAFIYVEREPDFVLAASVSGANLATEIMYNKLRKLKRAKKKT